MSVSDIEMESFGSECEKNLRKQPLKMWTVKHHTYLNEDEVNGVHFLTNRYLSETSPIDYLHQYKYFFMFK